jgi:hypothetical protein
MVLCACSGLPINKGNAAIARKLVTVEVHVVYMVTEMFVGQIYLPVFQFFLSVMIPLQLDTDLIRDWCLVPYEAAE